MHRLTWSERWMIVLTVFFSAVMIVLYLRMTQDDGHADYSISTERGGMTIGQYQSQPIDINSADLSRLMTLDGIGLELAERIIAYREEHGGFADVKELMQVDGIGEGKFAALKDRITCKEVEK